MRSSRSKKLIRKYGGHVMPFRELTETSRLAIAWYMAVDGEAWELPFDLAYNASANELKREFRSTLPWFTKKYGSKRFGYVEIPMDDMVEAVMQDEEMGRYGTFDEYHKWYVGQGHMPEHPTTKLWPVILSSDYEEETLQDGWHRLHDYYRKGVDIVPAVYFP